MAGAIVCQAVKPVWINDKLHSQLGRSTRPAQRRIDATDEEPAREAYGQCRVLEVDAKSALTDFTMGGHATGIAWSLNPYVGCMHRCAYCYVPDTMKVDRRRWGNYVVAKQNLPRLVEREMRTRKPLTVYISTATDPYQAAERDLEIVRRCLEIILRKDWPVEILTRSPLVLRDLDFLRRFSQLRVGLSVPTLDDEARKIVEPAAPPISARLHTLRQLADEGLTVFANYSPAYPTTSGTTMRDVARAFRDAGVSWVNTSYWRRQPSFLPALWERLQGTQWEDLARFIASEERQRAARAELAAALAEENVPLRTGFFNPPFDPAPARTRDTSLDSVDSTAPRARHGLLEPAWMSPTAEAAYPEYEGA
ncbi:MAG TPA: radical SAM protein [Candidatus Thermoplasmatota archaeon]|nr:radical SAM protein [Candidatus Thermoplasmatota archaeon]